MRKRTRDAIDAHLGVQVDALKIRAIVRADARGPAPLITHELTLKTLCAEEIPKLLDDMVAYCIGVGVRDPEEIAKALKPLKHDLSTLIRQLDPQNRQEPTTDRTEAVVNFAVMLVEVVHSRARAAIETARARDPSLVDWVKAQPVVGVLLLLAAVVGASTTLWKAAVSTVTLLRR